MHLQPEIQSMWKTRKTLSAILLWIILSIFIASVQSQNDHIPASDDSITGFFLEKDLSPTLAKRGE